MMLDLGLIANKPRLVVAQAAANPLFRAYQHNWDFEPVRAQPTLATAIQIGNPVSIHRAVNALKAFDGIVEQATEDELADASARADRTGMFNCPHTAVALASLEKLIGRGEVRKTDRRDRGPTANGLKFSEFKTGYHTHTLAGITPRHANPRSNCPTTTTPSAAPSSDRARRSPAGNVARSPSRTARSRVPLEVWKFGRSPRPTRSRRRRR